MAKIKNIRDVGAEQTVSRTNTEMMVSALGYSNKTNEIGVYTILLTMKEPVTGLSKTNLLSGNYAINPVKGANGSNVAPTILDEDDPQGEVSFSMKEDLNFVRENAPFGVDRSLLNAVLKGESFTMGDEIITIVGTNGTMKSFKARANAKEMNLPFKRLFGLEADEIKVTGAIDPKTGRVRTRKNTFRSANDLFSKTICLEFLTSVGGKAYVDVIPLVSVTKMVKDEGDVNSYNVEGSRLCDVWQRDNYVTEVSEIPTKLDKDEELTEIVVDCILANGVAEPTLSNVSKPLFAKISASGDITLSQKGETLKGKFSKNTRISARRFVVSGSTIVEQNAIVVVETTDGKNFLTGKATNFALGTGKTNYMCKVYNYNRNEEEMDVYQTPVAID